jgi:hypothetical protein
MQLKKDINFVLLKYIYYKLFYNNEILINKKNGIIMNKEQMSKVKICIPSLEFQKQIIRYYENKKKK